MSCNNIKSIPLDDAEGFLEECKTYNLVEKLSIKWKITDFSLMKRDMGFRILSPIVNSKRNSEIEWHLELSPGGESEDSKDYCGLFLYISGNTDPVAAAICMAIVNDYNVKLHKINLKTSLFRNKKGWGFNSFIKRKLLLEENSQFLKNDELQILCEITAGMGTVNSNGNCETIHSKEHDLEIFKSDLNLSKIFGDEKFSDITIVVEEEYFYANRIILAASSDIFWDMFGQSLKNKNSTIFIKDVSAKIFKEFLRYLYTNEVECLDDISHELVVVASKYRVRRLEKSCEQSLCKNLELANILDMLILSEEYKLDCLKQKVATLFLHHKKEIATSQKYKDIMNLRPLMIAELCTKLIIEDKM